MGLVFHIAVSPKTMLVQSVLLALLAGGASSAAAPKITATLYSESLCPDCIHFVTGAWSDVFNTPSVAAIIDFKQVVYGNAKTSKDNKTITCQHGPTECLDNTLQSCAVAQYKDNSTAWLPFIVCLENAGSNQAAKAEACANSNSLDWTKLSDCWNSVEGHELDLENGIATAALNPPHEFVPWVTLSGQSGTFCSNSDCDNFLQAVCDAYTGPKPSGCP